MADNEIPDEVRNRLALAIDVDDVVAAVRLGKAMRPWFGVAKVGLELFSAAGPDAVGAMIDLGYEVFLDLKLHDIPNTVHRSARVLGALGVSYLTFHAHGGVDMLKGGVEGLQRGAEDAGLPAPNSLAITVLTSDDTAPDHIVPARVAIALEAGCSGVVCAVSDLREVHHYAPRMLRVTPGIRLQGGKHHDQARAAGPGDAIAGGADLLVVGRAVTEANEPEGAAEQLVAEILGA
ncbi:MAG: orotidine-5'-phosphate decarboxylase [Acidimicrobiia bacterium]|nr:orotidine-5'-phosphate decarboxylase [Acidimicrobiia bacterium]